ncbi:MAG: 4Fe-4S binding protein [Bryobacteraceae bacterium]|nr:4Fe-4S binding protein [Bryobacteraceae bacterium]
MSLTEKWVPVIREENCTGCGLCVDACGPNSLDLVDGIAVLVRPHTCGSEEHCIGVCEDDAIQMAWVPMSVGKDCGKWRTAKPYEVSRERSWDGAIH